MFIILLHVAPPSPTAVYVIRKPNITCSRVVNMFVIPIFHFPMKLPWPIPDPFAKVYMHTDNNNNNSLKFKYLYRVHRSNKNKNKYCKTKNKKTVPSTSASLISP